MDPKTLTQALIHQKQNVREAYARHAADPNNEWLDTLYWREVDDLWQVYTTLRNSLHNDSTAIATYIANALAWPWVPKIEDVTEWLWTLDPEVKNVA